MASATAMAQEKETKQTTLNMDNGVIPIADNRGFTLQSQKGDFVFKPYMYIQTTGNYNYYDDCGLDKAYNQDNVANSGFSMPYAIIGFTGRAFGKIDYNVSINAAASGGNILQQAWIDYAASKEMRFRVGKFKTPFSHAYMTTLGETLFPTLPTSLTAAVILPYSLNALTPNVGTGFDLGVQMHGMIKDKWGYQVGIFNGTGAAVNNATKTLSDDIHIPSLLYAGRITYQPFGAMPMTQGNNKMLDEKKVLVGASVKLSGIGSSVKDVRLCVIDRLRSHVLTFASMNIEHVNDSTTMDVGTQNVSMYDAIQQKVFNASCVNCHGAATSAAAGLFLTADRSYNALVGKPSARLPQYSLVAPGNANGSVLRMVINTDTTHTWHYDHSKDVTSADIKSMIDNWINEGAEQ
ncbi:MAG: hypothetical protein IKK92_08590 [Prevotella sp.]|nr:hypothetical protein [Prevotella sp.]